MFCVTIYAAHETTFHHTALDFCHVWFSIHTRVCLSNNSLSPPDDLIKTTCIICKTVVGPSTKCNYGIMNLRCQVKYLYPSLVVWSSSSGSQCTTNWLWRKAKLILHALTAIFPELFYILGAVKESFLLRVYCSVLSTNIQSSKHCKNSWRKFAFFFFSKWKCSQEDTK